MVSSAGSGFGRRYYDALPYEIVWANDLNASACATYKANLKHAIHTGDIADVVDTLPKRADVIIGGFPCQDVSINGPKTVANGSRTILYRSMVDVIQRVKPRAFVAENVKGLLQAHAQKFFTQMVTEFEATGYAVTYKVYLSADLESRRCASALSLWVPSDDRLSTWNRSYSRLTTSPPRMRLVIWRVSQRTSRRRTFGARRLGVRSREIVA